MSLMLFGHPSQHDPANEGLELPVLAYWDGETAISVNPTLLKKGCVVNVKGKDILCTEPIIFKTEAERKAVAEVLIGKTQGINASLTVERDIVKSNTTPIEYTRKVVVK